MDLERFASHLNRPVGRGELPAGGFVGAAGGAACGDLFRVSLAVDRDDPCGAIRAARFDASGCGACLAAGSALVTLLGGQTILGAARVGSERIAQELGGLSPAKQHVAELAADALHRALGAAARVCRLATPPGARTLVAMSGGVDSAVAALLSAREGTESVGLTLELWSDPEHDGSLSCCSAQAVRGARGLAHRLGMPHFSIDLRAEFRAGVVDPWLTGYAAGRTPNPCVRCNGSVRIDAMLEIAQGLGAGTLVTGHYARIERGAGGALLRRAADPAKDQSYVLAGVRPESLERLRFPVGELHKPQVREQAREHGLTVAERPDSQDLCFLAGTGRARFLARHGELRARRGPIRDREGRELGEHQGTHGFTIGQRRGLGIGGGEPLYVLETDQRSNTVTVGPRAGLLADSAAVDDVTLRRPAAVVDGAKIRYRGSPVAARVRESELDAGEHSRVHIDFQEPIERTAPGQVACLYAGELLVGHGTFA